MVLTAKQQLFVQEFLLDLNATQAAVRAGYSRGTADKQGPRLLSHPDIRAAIDAAKAARSERTGVDAVWVLHRLVAEAEADLADLYDKRGDLKPIEEWPEIWRQGLVAGVEIDALYEGSGEERRQVGHVKKIRLSDRLRRLELIGKHVRVNAFQEQVALSLEGLGDRLNRAQARAAVQLAIETTAALAAPSVSFPADAAPVSVAAPAEQSAPAGLSLGGNRGQSS
ncbi:terminase small subunit [Bradyrhizobium sp. BEA-2-5]|uniref:terminase small subunit n=1 Tax=Bradyrhizobium sp. BEA-2-5 TaxID=3080015 RepID=UPI00293F3CC3|nr:terminase small subunit [Bradyrhizobium sp. BEA-2-5]WOH79014.1 terminase small subunit [Bradyrhizobium sp. BEA-2-5]